MVDQVVGTRGERWARMALASPSRAATATTQTQAQKVRGAMTYDVEAVRSHFPALAQGAAHFDGPGGSQVPEVVADAVRDALTSAIANRGQVTAAERFADEVVVAARQAMADLLGADPGGIVFGRSMTALTFDFSRTLARTWREGDEVVVSRLDHDANIRPWILAAQTVGATVRWVDFDAETGELPTENVARMLSERTRLVAITAASNLIGTKPNLPEISAMVHDAGALLYVDGVHATAHGPTDVQAIGADVYVCSPYKFLGPHCGVLAGRPSCWRNCARTNCCPPRMRSPSVSNWAPCPMNCWPAPPPRWTSWPLWRPHLRDLPTAAHAWSRRSVWSTSTRTN